jgi:hypothetical protein
LPEPEFFYPLKRIRDIRPARVLGAADMADESFNQNRSENPEPQVKRVSGDDITPSLEQFTSVFPLEMQSDSFSLDALLRQIEE